MTPFPHSPFLAPRPPPESARIIIAEVNQQMPRTLGDAFIHVSKLTHAVPVNYPLAELLTFPETIHSADGVAEYLGIPPAEVYKTLVVERPGKAGGGDIPGKAGGKPLLVMVAAGRELDLKKLAASLGEKKLRMARHADTERLTGLQVGGISALALLNRGFQICLDRPATKLDRIVISAGRRGVNLRVGVGDLIKVVGGRVVEAT